LLNSDRKSRWIVGIAAVIMAVIFTTVLVLECRRVRYLESVLKELDQTNRKFEERARKLWQTEAEAREFMMVDDPTDTPYAAALRAEKWSMTDKEFAAWIAENLAELRRGAEDAARAARRNCDDLRRERTARETHLLLEWLNAPRPLILSSPRRSSVADEGVPGPEE
jgi:hypothetical protein